MPQLIGLCGYDSTGRSAIALATGKYLRASFMAAARADLTPVFKRMPPHVTEHERPMLMEYRAVCLRLDAGHWHKRIKLPAADCVICDVYDVADARFVLDRKGVLFRIHKPGALPADAAESKATDAIHSGFCLPEIHHNGTPQEAAEQIMDWIRVNAK